MSVISTWAMSVAGISMLAVLIDLILPSGQTKKYIKGVFALIVVIVVITPIFNLFKANFKTSDIFEENAIIIQEDFVYEINQDRLNKLESMIVEDLNQQGVSNISLILNANIFTTDLIVDAVFVSTENVVIFKNLEHKDIKEIVIKSIKNI